MKAGNQRTYLQPIYCKACVYLLLCLLPYILRVLILRLCLFNCGKLLDISVSDWLGKQKVIPFILQHCFQKDTFPCFMFVHMPFCKIIIGNLSLSEKWWNDEWTHWMTEFVSKTTTFNTVFRKDLKDDKMSARWWIFPVFLSGQGQLFPWDTRKNMHMHSDVHI